MSGWYFTVGVLVWQVCDVTGVRQTVHSSFSCFVWTGVFNSCLWFEESTYNKLYRLPFFWAVFYCINVLSLRCVCFMFVIMQIYDVFVSSRISVFIWMLVSVKLYATLIFGNSPLFHLPGTNRVSGFGNSPVFKLPGTNYLGRVS